MRELPLPGLDGTTLLGFVAGIGVLTALRSTRTPSNPEPTLCWRLDGTWYPCLSGVETIDELTNRILADSRSREVESLLSFRYVKVEKKGPKLVAALTPPRAVLREALQRMLASECPWTADVLGTLCCESASEELDNEKAPSPDDLERLSVAFDPSVPLTETAGATPFDFTSRNTQFLDQIRRIRDVLTPDSIALDLTQGLGTSSQRIMRWDTLVDAPWALFSGLTPTARPVAEWLVFRGISCFPLTAVRGVASMPGFIGRRKSGELSWGLWETPLPRDVVRTLLGVPWSRVPPGERSVRGINTVITVAFRKDATGYDGAVSAGRILG